MPLLDLPDPPADGWRNFAGRLIDLAATVQSVLAFLCGRPARDYEFTLSVAVLGRLRAGWISVGDSPLALCRHGITGVLAIPESREFANQTAFVSPHHGEGAIPFQCGLIPGDGLTGLAAMSDGTASRLLHLPGHVPAAALQAIVHGVGEDGWTRPHLRGLLLDPAWDEATGDDRSLAVLGAKFQQPEIRHPESNNPGSTDPKPNDPTSPKSTNAKSTSP